ncbi:hypothetical protein D3C77_627720 [compost metagenome]
MIFLVYLRIDCGDLSVDDPGAVAIAFDPYQQAGLQYCAIALGDGEIDVQHAVVGQGGDRRTGFYVLAEVDASEAKLTGERGTNQALGDVFLSLGNQCVGFIMGGYVLFVVGVGHGLAAQALGSFQMGLGQA